MSRDFFIQSRRIGKRQTPFVIAEIGVNHDGSLARAIDLVEAASASGADAVKLQIFRAKQLMHPSALMADYQRDAVNDKDALQMLRRLELDEAALAKLVSMIRACGMMPLATPFSPIDVQTIQRLNLPAIKIASPDIVNFPLLSAAIDTGLPVICSTGAATLEEIDRAAAWFTAAKATYCLMHCTSSYPVADADSNLCWIDELRHRYDVPVGFSDHTMAPLAGAFAVAAGATLLEKHLTYDCTAEGPDHSASAEPEQFKEYVDAARQAGAMRGVKGKHVLKCEQDVRHVSRQSLVTTRAIQVGEMIDPRSLTVQRPGTGVSAADFKKAIGTTARKAIPAGTILQWDMLSAA